MKILLINAFYKEASTGKIVYDIMRNLEPNKKYQMFACYGRGKTVDDNRAYRFCSELYAKFGIAFGMISGRYYSGRKVATHRLIRYINNIKPDIVHLHCLNSYVLNIYELLDYLKCNHIKTILTLHAEFMYTGSCGYSYECEKWMYEKGCYHCQVNKNSPYPLFDTSHKNWIDMCNAFKDFDNLILTSVSPWLLDRAKKSYILGKYENHLILNGIDTEIFKRIISTTENNKKIILHVTASFEADVKGGTYVRKLANKFLEAGDDSVQFIIAGKTNNKNIPKNVETLGPVYDQHKLAELYSSAEITLLTSKKETFSMVCAESLCCGTPVVGFEAGAPEQISISDLSEFVEQGNVECLYNTIVKWLSLKIDKDKISEEAIKKYSSKTMSDQYRKIYDELMESSFK